MTDETSVPLSFETLSLVANGSVPAMFDAALIRCCADINSGDEIYPGKRTVLLAVCIEPRIDKKTQRSIGVEDVSVHCESRVPKRGGLVTTGQVGTNHILLFNPNSTKDRNQTTIMSLPGVMPDAS